VNFSLWLWPYGRWGDLTAMARATQRAEELGFAGVSVSDHTVPTTGSESAGLGDLWPDWSVLSAYLATQTSSIRILTSLVVPYRPVLPTAKQIATIDQLSGGRFTLAAAVGWLRPEFEMLGVDFTKRGAITDEYLRAMKILWTEDEPRFHGEHVRFSDLVFEPKCAQDPHVPIWIAGGSGRGPIGRLLELGDGWMPMGGDTGTELRDTIADLKERASERGRDPEALTFRYTIGIGEVNAALASISKSIDVGDPAALSGDGSPDAVAAEIQRLGDAGFTELAINFSGESAAEVMDQLDWFGAEVMSIL
jgi:probable F420-dependent oxidoreductase